jgi:GPI-anchor transamidase subunit T
MLVAVGKYGVGWRVMKKGEVTSEVHRNNEVNKLAHSIDNRWISLQNALGGLFCTSLSPRKQHTRKDVTYPTLTFPPQGLLRSSSIAKTYDHQHRLRLNILPSERLCTENLTPFLKLLPCNNRAGIAELLNPHALVSADWHGISIHVTQTLSGTRLEFIVRSVFDPIRIRNSGKAGTITICDDTFSSSTFFFLRLVF